MAHFWVLRSPRSQLLHRPTFPSLPQHPRVQPQPKSLVLVSQELLKGILPQSVLGISSLGPCGAGKWGKCALNYLAFYLALPLGLAWKISWMEEPGRLQSMGSLGVEHD